MLLRGTTTYIPSDQSLLGQLREMKPGDKICVVRSDGTDLHQSAWTTFGYEADYWASLFPPDEQ